MKPAFILLSFSVGALAASAAAPISYEKQVKPILVEFCWDCHGDGAKKGGLALDKYADQKAMLADRTGWKHVIDNLAQRVMPPDRKPQPTDAQRDLIIKWIEQEVFRTDCDNPDPGRVTIRRLNRVEYNNTIRDLVGVDFQPANDFPADDSGYGFDNIGDVLSLPPIMLEKYLAAAEKILEAAIVVGNPQRPTRRYNFSQLQGGARFGDSTKVLVSNGELFVQHNFTQGGEYVFRVRAFQQRAGNEAAKMTVRLGGTDLKTFDVSNVEDSPGTFEVRSRVNAGTHRVAAAFLNDFYQPPPPGKRNPTDRNLYVLHLEIEGPMDAEPDLPESHRRIFTTKPGPATNKLEAARAIVAEFTRRAYRRPVQPAEVDRLLKIFQVADANKEPFERSVQLTLQAVLVSPHFLFRGELQPEPDNPKRIHPINEYALASRLSYFLWSTMPDEQLFDYASRGQLRRNLGQQVQRMLRDQKARELVENFGGQWLMLRNLDIVSPDPKLFPEYDDTLKALMRKETETLFEHIMREDRSIFEFLTADYTFINERLAAHYDIPNIKGDQFQRVSLVGTPRRGVLTHASILTLTSNPTRTSPVKRGLFVLENLLATPPPPAPPDVPPLEETKKLTGTLRQQLEQHRENPACASCHARMDPLGFGLENFDAVGAWRDKENNVTIDPAGKLVSGENFSGPVELNKILVTSKRKEFVHSLSEKMLTYALGRGLEFYDKCALDEIAKGVDRNGDKFSVLVLEIVKSVPFQLRRGEGDRSAAGGSQ
jgi:mono/diheme cytochrome c family protein